MARIVRKYGGSSLRDTEKINEVARQISEIKSRGDDVVVVVSAMAATTDDLISMARKLNPDPPHREMDMLLSVGERISCSLLAMALDKLQVKAISYTGSQVGIITDTCHNEAKIIDIKPFRLIDALNKGLVVIVAGFQGVSIEKEITTLGRGGSDATAIALAAAIKADRCELMKDVDGLHYVSPEIIENSRIIESIEFENALLMAASGTRAIQVQAVNLAKEFEIPVGIGNSLKDLIGTIITTGSFDRGMIAGISKTDGLIFKHGKEIKTEDEDNRYFRLVQNSDGYDYWYISDIPDEATFTCISIITNGRIIKGLRPATISLLQKTQVDVFYMVEVPYEFWFIVKSSEADRVIKLLYTEYSNKCWIKSEISEAGK